LIYVLALAGMADCLDAEGLLKKQGGLPIFPGRALRGRIPCSKVILDADFARKN
jgi:hypothetical protein